MQHQRDIVVPLPGPKHPKAYLKHYGFKHPVRVHVGIVLLSAVPITAIVLAALFHVVKARDDGFPAAGNMTAADVVVAVSAIGALLVGYHQWREARRESSMERYYDRLEIPNRRNDGQQSTRHRTIHEMMKPCLPELENEDPDALMYVYVELDNLEYVIGKYKLGYMKAKQACRGLRTFQLRCWSPHFRRIAQHRVHAGDYNPRTGKVVDRVCEEITKMEKLPYSKAPSLPARGEWPPRRRATDRELVPSRRPTLAEPERVRGHWLMETFFTRMRRTTS